MNAKKSNLTSFTIQMKDRFNKEETFAGQYMLDNEVEYALSDNMYTDKMLTFLNYEIVEEMQCTIAKGLLKPWHAALCCPLQ